MGRLLALAAIVAALCAGVARADFTLAAYSDAVLGSLHVTTGVLLQGKTVDLRGVWTDAKVSCRVKRRLTIDAIVDFTPPGGSGGGHTARHGSFRDFNCAEGGPNVGFTLTARQLHLACPNGSWKPGDYSFSAAATEPTTKLHSHANLGWKQTQGC